MTNTHLLIIDPQNDFCDQDGAALPVVGAKADLRRLANFIDRSGTSIDEIHVSLDSHRLIHIAHPVWWVDKDGNHPNPFTLISNEDVVSGRWKAANPEFQNRSLEYTRSLERGGKYVLMVWPPHCLLGSWGHNIEVNLNSALIRWSEENFKMIDFVLKGSNPFTEHYGALKAEVKVGDDPSANGNPELLRAMFRADRIMIAGEASSHCVRATVTQLIEAMGKKEAHKFFLMTDCMSPVARVPGGPDFPGLAKAWLDGMRALGMNLVQSESFVL